MSPRRNAQAVGRGLLFDELVQEEAVGLARAVERLSDPSSPDACDAIEERSRHIERQARHWLRAMAVAVPRGGLARNAAQMSHEHHPAHAADRDGNDGQRDGEGRAGGQTLPEHGVGSGPHERADRDGNDGQRDGEGRAGGQTLPEHGVGSGPHERADRDRGRERAVADGRGAGRVVQGRRRDAGHEPSGQDRGEAPPLELLVDARELGAAPREPLADAGCGRARERERRQPSEHRAAESEHRSSHAAERQPAGGGEHRPGEERGRQQHPRGERGQRRGDAGPHDEVAKVGGGMGEQDSRGNDRQHEPERAQEPHWHPVSVAAPPAVDVSGVVHVHSTYSDGTATVDEIAADAAAAGADVVMLTDHDSLAARRDGWEGRREGVVVLVGTGVSPKAGHYLALGVDREIPHAGQSAREIAEAVREAGGVGFAAHPFSRGGHMLAPALAPGSFPRTAGPASTTRAGVTASSCGA